MYVGFAAKLFDLAVLGKGKSKNFRQRLQEYR